MKLINITILLLIAVSVMAKEKILLEESAIIYLKTDKGDNTPIEGSVILTKHDCILKFNNKITIQQNLKIDQLTIPLMSIKELKVIKDGKSFEYILGNNKMVVDSDSSLKIVNKILTLQK